jgi:hypothetical protein
MTRSQSGANPAQRRTTAQRMLALPAAAFGAVRNWLDDGRYRERHRRLIDEFEDAGVLDEMLGGTGATRKDLGWLGLSPLAATQLMDRMMRRLAIRPPAAVEEPFWQLDAQWQCLGCENWRRCRRWLESGRQDDGYRAFCRNADRFDRRREATRAACRPSPMLVRALF